MIWNRYVGPLVQLNGTSMGAEGPAMVTRWTAFLVPGLGTEKVPSEAA